MAISLEELKRQREQIQKHLDWLDTKITELESATDKSAAPLNVSISKVESQDHPATPADASKTPAGAPSSEEAAKAPPLAATPDIEGSTYKAKTQDELLRAKVGCLVLFVAGCALFLFLLFGLPYLL